MSGAAKRYDESAAGALLDAGAVLPVGSTAREDADTLTARTYAHPALDGRPVVRLVPGTLGEAEDLALDFLGLVRAPEAPEVGQVRRETLGFPAWALVNDPANGHHALALVRDVERLARQAKSRPGTAKEGFEELGTRLGRAVPHFLPTFYEQAARVFLQYENTTYAAAFFGKARDVERVHALAVDEERQRAVFLEFAFAGALTVKALKEHVKALSERLAPAEAWAQFRQLTVERCAAGMPPYASLPQDARGLVKAAGLDRVAEECALVADLIASPAAVRAPASFWNSYRATLVVLCEERPEVRARLLEIMPAGLGQTVEDDEFWLSLLAECGADRLLVEGGADAVDWLARWDLHRKHRRVVPRRSPATLALVARLAPRLRESGRPVDVFSGRWHPGADPDLLDLCAAEGVPLAVPEAGTSVFLALDDWFADDREGRRDLVAFAADPRLRRLLYEAVEALGRGRAKDNAEALAGHPVLREVLREWLEDAAGELTGAVGLPAARAAVQRLRTYRAVAGRVAPDAVARAAAHETAPLLGRTLRTGLLDELGWPALDEALDLLDTGRPPRNDDPLRVHEAWPALILSRRHKAVVVGPEGVLLEHDLRIPVTLQQWEQPTFRYTDGELLVAWRTDGKQSGYWSARPSEVLTIGGEQVSGWYGNDADTPSLPLTGGGRATGGRTLHAGDTVVPPRRPVIGDGTTLWRLGRDGRRQVWLEYDPATGSHGRASLPAFLRTGVLEGATLRQEHCAVLPLRPGLEESPFGTDGTVLGRWVRADDEGRLTTGTPDGRTVTLDGRHGRCVPLGALRLPGGAAPVAVASDRQVVLYAGDDTSPAGELGRVTQLEPGREFAAGTRLVPPADFWHALRPRDAAASAVLRGLDDVRAAALLAAGEQALKERQARVAAAEGDAKAAVPGAEEVVREAVGRVLPEVAEPRLLTGVAAVVRAVLELGTSVATFVTPPAPAERDSRTLGMFADLAPEHGDDRSLREAVAGIMALRQYGWYGNERRWATLRQLKAVHHVLAGHPADGPPLARRARESAGVDGWHSDEFTVPGMETGWTVLLEALRPLAYRAASPLLTEEHRRTLLLLFDTLLEGPLARQETRWREVQLSEPFEKKHGTAARVGQVLRREGRTVVVLCCQHVDNAQERVLWLALDHDPSGRFEAVAHFTRETEGIRPSALSADALADVVRLVREKGPAPWQPEAGAALVGATGGGLGPAQAAVLLAARPDIPDSGQLAGMGLKKRESELAGELLDTLGADVWRPMIGELLPEDPADLWTSGPRVDAVGRTWTRLLGDAVRLPEDLAGELSRAGVPTGTAEEVLNPGRTPWIARTTVQRPDEHGNLVPEDSAAMPTGRHLRNAVAALAHLAYALPYGHPLRAALSEGLAALRRRIADPGLLMDLDVGWAEKGGTAAVPVRKAYGMPATGGAGADGLVRVGEVFALRPWYGEQEMVLVAPGALSGVDDPAFGLIEGIVGPGRGFALRAVRTLLGEELARAVEADGDVPEGAGVPGGAGFAQDPGVSVPGLVGEVAGVCGVSEDAAVLYLQLLALPDPTDRNCARWTGWRPARIKKARTELAASGLVVTAKRSRAGRTLFLPCGWSDLRAPALPMETWKEALYPLRDHAQVAPIVPVAELFTRAWERVRDGDGPAFEVLRTARGRRRRK